MIYCVSVVQIKHKTLLEHCLFYIFFYLNNHFLLFVYYYLQREREREREREFDEIRDERIKIKIIIYKTTVTLYIFNLTDDVSDFGT